MTRGIGTGSWQNHVRVYPSPKRSGRPRLRPEHEAAEEAAAPPGRRSAARWRNLRSRVRLGRVPTPTTSDGEEVIAAGVHALIEKPLCLTVRECEQLIGQIPEGLTVGVGHIERFNPVVTEVARVVHDPLYVSFHRHNPASARVSGSSVVEDLMIHDIDVAFNVLFPGREYTVHASGTGDVAAALAAFGRTPVYLSASRKSSKKVRSVYIEEEDRTIEGDFMTQEVYVYRKPEAYGQENGLYRQENIIEKLLVNKVEPLKIELSTFVRAARDGKPFTVTPEQGLANVRVCEAISRSLAA